MVNVFLSASLVILFFIFHKKDKYKIYLNHAYEPKIDHPANTFTAKYEIYAKVINNLILREWLLKIDILTFFPILFKNQAKSKRIAPKKCFFMQYIYINRQLSSGPKKFSYRMKIIAKQALAIPRGVNEPS